MPPSLHRPQRRRPKPRRRKRRHRLRRPCRSPPPPHRLNRCRNLKWNACSRNNNNSSSSTSSRNQSSRAFLYDVAWYHTILILISDEKIFASSKYTSLTFTTLT